MFHSDSQQMGGTLGDAIASRFLLDIPEDDREAAISARIFNHVCLGVIAFLVVAGLASAFVFARKAGTALTTLTLGILLCFAVLLARRHGVRAGGALLTMGLWVGFSANLVLAGKIDSVITSTYIAITCLAGILVGPSFAIITAGLTVAFTFAMTCLQSLGYGLPHYYPMPLWSAWVVLLFPILVTVPTITGTLRAYYQAVRVAGQEIEARKKTEASLAESETRYRSLFERNVSGVAVYKAVNDGEDFVFVDVNQAAERIERISKSELIGRSVIEAFPSVKEFGLFGALQSVWRTGRPESLPVALYDDERITGWRENYVFRVPTGEIVTVYSDETNRKKAEQALKESEELFRSATENATVGVCLVGLDGRFMSVNPKMSEIVGYTADELTQMTFNDITHHEDHDVGRAFLQRALAGESDSASFEKRYVCKSGEMVYLNVSTKLHYGSGGGPQYFITHVQDITDRKKADISLDKYRRRLESLWYISGLTTVEEDNLYDIILEQLLGFTDSEHAFFGYITDDDRQMNVYAWSRGAMAECRVEDQYLQFPLKKAGVWAEAFRLRKPVILNDYHAYHPRKRGVPEGHVSIDRMMSVPVVRQGRVVSIGTVVNKQYEYTEDDARHVEAFLSEVMTLMERKLANESLRKKSEELSTLLDAMPALVWICLDPECRVITGNRRVNELFGVSAGENLSQTAAQASQARAVKHFKPDGTEYSPEELPIQQCIEQAREVTNVEFSYRLPDGRQIFAVGNAAPLYESDGRVRGSVCAVLDITALKKAEEERQRLQEQLMQARKWESLGTLTGGIAHDFNNLLTIINGYAEVLLSAKPEDDPDYADLRKILETGISAADLVQKLLSFSGKDAGSFQALNVNQIVKDCVARMERTFPATIEIETNLAEDPGTINGQASQVEQVLMNLCINAKEAMPHGGRLTIETGHIFVDEDYCRRHPGSEPGSFTRVEITDTGAGIGKEIVDRIFDPFFSTKGWDYHKGTGLGLSVAKGIAERHGGWITCESDPYEGSTFSLYIPAIEKARQAGETPATPQQSEQDGKILLVDNEEMVGALGKRILERAGHKVVTASNGEEAVRIYAKEQSNIALVILDCIMSRTGGEECLEELLEVNPDVKVVISTGNPLSIDDRARLAKRAKGFVDKPYQARNLLKVVEEALDTTGREGV